MNLGIALIKKHATNQCANYSLNVYARIVKRCWAITDGTREEERNSSIVLCFNSVWLQP
eukprot:c27566_g1_i1 orf=3-176(-)